MITKRNDDVIAQVSLFNFSLFLVYFANICPNHNVHQLSTMCAYDKINECHAQASNYTMWLIRHLGISVFIWFL